MTELRQDFLNGMSCVAATVNVVATDKRQCPVELEPGQCPGPLRQGCTNCKYQAVAEVGGSPDAPHGA